MAKVAIARLPVEDGVNKDNVMQYHYFEPGEEVKGHGVDKDMLAVWEASGSVGDAPDLLPSAAYEKEALEARVKELEAQLASAKDANDNPDAANKAQQDLLTKQAAQNKAAQGGKPATTPPAK